MFKSYRKVRLEALQQHHKARDCLPNRLQNKDDHAKALTQPVILSRRITWGSTVNGAEHSFNDL